MNKTRKGFLCASSIITIVFSALMLILSIVIFSATTVVNEKFILEDYETEDNYAIVYEPDGGYVISYEEDGVMLQMTDEDIALIVSIAKAVICVLGVAILGMTAAMLTLSILILVGLRKGKFKKGCTIALLVLSLLNQNLLVSVFLIVALTTKDENKPKDENKQDDVIQSKQDDIVLKDINE